MARDYFHFVTKFFEPINVSATHIYHSALELSPLSSIVRRLYYHQRHAPFPRVAGTPDSWDQSLTLPYARSEHRSYTWSAYTWSPCGQFIAVQTKGFVEIHDPLSFELLSTLQPTKPTSQLIGTPAYSPDGHSLASLSNTSLIIWDIQTGGVAKEILCDETPVGLLVWSPDGGTVNAMVGEWGKTVHAYDIASGTQLTLGELYSSSIHYLWVHNTFLRAITVLENGQAHRINILEAGSVFTEVESFYIDLRAKNTWVEFFSEKKYYRAVAFSPAAYHISMTCGDEILVLDLRDSCHLLKQRGDFHSHCFSSNGSLFAASLGSTSFHVWKCTFSHYTPWREFPSSTCFSPCFSPSLSSVLGHSNDTLQVLQLVDPTMVACPNNHGPLIALPSCGTYIVTGHIGDSTITIVNLLSLSPSHSIDTGMNIKMFALTGRVLLVEGPKTIAAWWLTDDGTVEGVSGDMRAGYHNRIWTIPKSPTLRFVVKDQTVAVQDYVKERLIHKYHTGTGEVLGFTPTLPPSGLPYSLTEMYNNSHSPGNWVSLNQQKTWSLSEVMLQGGWVKSLKGEHWLWMPVKWRKPLQTLWLYDPGILCFYLESDHEKVLIKF
jgi:hypothetical protein